MIFYLCYLGADLNLNDHHEFKIKNLRNVNFYTKLVYVLTDLPLNVKFRKIIEGMSKKAQQF